jgi:uncharacterized protein (DUF1810 family)
VIEGPDPCQLHRFVDAQERVFETALLELQEGRKQNHWIWFIFPQLAELGRSPTSRFYGISSLHEARAYLAHPLLGGRYRQCVEAVRSWAGRKDAAEILGDVDAMKLRSSLTLFEVASGDPLLAEVLQAFFEGPDDATLQILKRS